MSLGPKPWDQFAHCAAFSSPAPWRPAGGRRTAGVSASLDSPENLLPLGAILRNVGALLLSTITILITALAQEWIAGAAGQIPHRPQAHAHDPQPILTAGQATTTEMGRLVADAGNRDWDELTAE